MIHREALAEKHLGQSVSEVLSLCVKVVNLIKTRPLQSQLFSQLSNELGQGFPNLLLSITQLDNLLLLAYEHFSLN